MLSEALVFRQTNHLRGPALATFVKDEFSLFILLDSVVDLFTSPFFSSICHCYTSINQSVTGDELTLLTTSCHKLEVMLYLAEWVPEGPHFV